MKQHTYTKDTWQGWVNALTSHFQRHLTQKEAEKAMREYITGKSVESYLEELK